MKESGSRYLVLVAGKDYLRFGGQYAKVGARIGEAVGAHLSALEGRVLNIVEVGQAGALAVCAMAIVG